MERLVAGVDGSAESVAALRWAIREAVLRGASVDAVLAWHYPLATAGEGFGRGLPLTAWPDLSEASRDVLNRAVDAAVADFDTPPTIDRIVIQEGRRVRYSSSPRAPACWSWAHAVMAASPRSCSGRSAPTV